MYDRCSPDVDIHLIFTLCKYRYIRHKMIKAIYAYRDQPRQGFVFYHGPVYVSDTWFGDFADTDNYRSGALGFQRDNDGHSSPISAVSGIKFAFSDVRSKKRLEKHEF